MIINEEQKKLPPFQQTSLSRAEFLRAAGAAAVGLAAAGCQRGPASVAPVETQAPTQAVAAASPGKTASDPAESPNAPLGMARGLHPGRVTWVHNPKATRWDGSKGFWWQEENVDQNELFAMLSQALQVQTGESDDAAAWDARRGRHFAGCHRLCIGCAAAITAGAAISSGQRRKHLLLERIALDGETRICDGENDGESRAKDAEGEH